MNTEEILGTLEELADNVGNCLYDWELSDLEQLEDLIQRLKETVREVVKDNVMGKNCG